MHSLFFMPNLHSDTFQWCEFQDEIAVFWQTVDNPTPSCMERLLQNVSLSLSTDIIESELVY